MSIWHRRLHLLALNIQKPDSQATPAPAAHAATAPPPRQPDHDLLHDHAKDVLSNAPISQDQKADLYDHYHDSKNARDLAGRLQPLAIPEHVALALLEAKKKSVSQSPADKILETLNSLPKHTLDAVEAYPKVLEHFVKAAIERE
jgi:hypothetical protein